MGSGPVEKDDPKKGVIKSGEFKGKEVVFTPNGDVRFTGNDSAGGTSGDPSTTYKNLGDGKYGSSRGILDIGPLEEVAEQSSSGGGGGGGGSGNPKPKPGHGDPVIITDPVDTIIPGTGGLLAGEQMNNWNPISSNGNGGAGLNPLVDPNEWLVELPELNMGKQSRTWIPNKGFYGGLI